MSDSERNKRFTQPSPSKDAEKPARVKPKTAAEAQRAQLERMFADPSKEVVLPEPPKPKEVAAPRDMIPNVQGSSAGAGSGEFHIYKQARRREMDRIKSMEDEEARERAEAEFRAKQQAMKEADEARIAKNRAKRQKKKAKRGTKGKGASAGNTKAQNGKNNTEEASASDDSDSDDGEDRQKKRKLAGGAPGSIVFRGQDEKEQDDDQPREEEVKVKRVAEAVLGSADAAPVAPQAGISIVDDD